jgi:hypothetical protein
MFFFFYISRYKWKHDECNSRNHARARLEADATNDISSLAISNVQEENNHASNINENI